MVRVRPRRSKTGSASAGPLRASGSITTPPSDGVTAGWNSYARKPGLGAFTGIVEADETYFLESRKGSREWTRVSIGNPNPSPLAALFPALGLCRAPRGVAALLPSGGYRGSRSRVPVLIARDRSGVTTDAVLMRADAASVAAVLGPILKPRETLLCTDSARIYRAFAQAAGVTHRPVNERAGQRVRQGVFHIQNVNAYHGRLKGGCAGLRESPPATLLIISAGGGSWTARARPSHRKSGCSTLSDSASI